MTFRSEEFSSEYWKSFCSGFPFCHLLWLAGTTVEAPRLPSHGELTHVEITLLRISTYGEV